MVIKMLCKNLRKGEEMTNVPKVHLDNILQRKHDPNSSRPGKKYIARENGQDPCLFKGVFLFQNRCEMGGHLGPL